MKSLLWAPIKPGHDNSWNKRNVICHHTCLCLEKNLWGTSFGSIHFTYTNNKKKKKPSTSTTTRKETTLNWSSNDCPPYRESYKTHPYILNQNQFPYIYITHAPSIIIIYECSEKEWIGGAQRYSKWRKKTSAHWMMFIIIFKYSISIEMLFLFPVCQTCDCGLPGQR